MKKFEEARSRTYGYLVVDIQSSIPEQDRLQNDIFESTNQQVFEPSNEETVSGDDGHSSMESIDYIHDLSPPGK